MSTLVSIRDLSSYENEMPMQLSKLSKFSLYITCHLPLHAFFSLGQYIRCWYLSHIRKNSNIHPADVYMGESSNFQNPELSKIQS